MKKLSIIIPAYNAEPYIAACVESIVKQSVSPDDYEVVVINDGSKDRTYEIVMELAEQYPQVHIIDQKNQGVGAARNHGADRACGEYVWYVDADDEATSDALETIISAIDEHRPDVLAVTILKIMMDGQEILCGQDDGQVKNMLDDETILQYDLRPYPYAYIFKREFWQDCGVRFLTHIRNEDEQWVPRLLFFAQKVTKIHKTVYRYLMRETSFTTQPKNIKHSIFSLTVVASSIKEFIRQHKMSADVYKVFDLKIQQWAMQAVDLVVSTRNLTLYKQVMKDLKKARINPFRCTLRYGFLSYLRSCKHTLRLRLKVVRQLYLAGNSKKNAT